MSDNAYTFTSFDKSVRGERSAVEIRVFWGGELLERVELAPPRSFVVGDASEATTKVDFTIPNAVATLGATASALVRYDGGVARVVIPEGAHAVWRRERTPFAAPVDPIAEREVILDDSKGVDVHLSGLVFAIRGVEREARCPRAAFADGDGRLLAFFGLSVLGNAALVASLMMSSPPFGITADDGMDKERIFAMLQYLDASAEKEEQATPAPTDDAPGGGPGAQAAKGESGALGRPESVEHHRHASGTAAGSSPSPATSRLEEIRDAAHFGLIGLLSSSTAAPTIAPFDSEGIGAEAFAGGFFGEIGEQNGSGGLALTGLGSGGGDRGDRIALGGIRTCADQFCGGLGPGGTGSSQSLARLDHAPKAPRIRMGTSTSDGSLPPEVIQRIVRQSFGRFRGCYEDGLRANPSLEGRVTARFVIARDGSVASVQSGGTDLPDARVVSCVLRAYTSLSFPAPKDGVVRVTYPLMFSPSA